MPTVYIDGKKHTPSSGTLKKMKRKAAAEAASKSKAPKEKKAKSKKEAPIPKDRPKKDKAPVKGLDLPSNERAKASAASQKLKGPVPKKNKVGITKGGNTGDKTKKGANQTATYLKRKKQLGN